MREEDFSLPHRDDILGPAGMLPRVQAWYGKSQASAVERKGATRKAASRGWLRQKEEDKGGKKEKKKPGAAAEHIASGEPDPLDVRRDASYMPASLLTAAAASRNHSAASTARQHGSGAGLQSVGSQAAREQGRADTGRSASRREMLRGEVQCCLSLSPSCVSSSLFALD